MLPQTMHVNARGPAKQRPIVAPGDAAVTANNIRASATLFRLGFVGDLVQAPCFLLTAMALYLLLKHVNTLVASAMVTFVSVSVAIVCLNLLNQFIALSIATGEGYASVFGSVGSDTLAMLFVDMHHDGYLIAQMFFGLWLLPLGYLVAKSGYFPRALGVVLMVGCFGCLLDLFAHFLAPPSRRASHRSCSPPRWSGSCGSSPGSW